MPDQALYAKPTVAITMGDPCGVGPEIIAKALVSPDLFTSATPVVIGDAGALARAIELVGSNLSIRRVADSEEIVPQVGPGIIQLITPASLSAEDIVYGRPTERTCSAIAGYIEKAVELARSGLVQAVCTCPIHKGNMHASGFAFPGHTEFLQDLTGAEEVVMMLAGPRLRVSLVTIHHALHQVPGLITSQRLESTIAVTSMALRRDFGLESARIAVCGLNPHAGEGGRFGDEEQRVIGPVVRGFAGDPHCMVSGPFPPDTIFFRAYSGEFDAIVSMYHDQGLIPIKLVHFHDAVNVSLGLPIIRTSVDHGTAYEIAGSGRADAGSLKAAFIMASCMARNRQRFDLHHSTPTATT